MEDVCVSPERSTHDVVGRDVGSSSRVTHVWRRCWSWERTSSCSFERDGEDDGELQGVRGTNKEAVKDKSSMAFRYAVKTSRRAWVSQL